MAAVQFRPIHFLRPRLEQYGLNQPPARPARCGPDNDFEHPMKNFRFPRWTAPLLGVIVGSFCGLRAGLRAQIPLVWFVTIGAAIGGLAGALILLLEPAARVPANPDLPAYLQRASPINQSGVVGRFLAVTGSLLCWFPVLGLVLNLIGWALNRKSDDWARLVSLIGLIIAAGTSTLFVVLLSLDIIN